MSNNSSSGFAGFWLIVFVVIKVGGTALTNWSWLWLLFPIVPVLVVLLQHLGVL